MKIAVIGTGIAGNVASYLLAAEHDLTVFEQNDHVGGHTNTVRVDAADGVHNVDTGFVVFNEERYPSFARLLEKLGVESQPSSMSFSVHSEVDGLEYSNRSLFAQRRNAGSRTRTTRASFSSRRAACTPLRTSLPTFYGAMGRFLRTPEQGADTVARRQRSPAWAPRRCSR
jgi:predicted NAD/FAD-binding protein